MKWHQDRSHFEFFCSKIIFHFFLFFQSQSGTWQVIAAIFGNLLAVFYSTLYNISCSYQWFSNEVCSNYLSVVGFVVWPKSYCSTDFLQRRVITSYGPVALFLLDPYQWLSIRLPRILKRFLAKGKQSRYIWLVNMSDFQPWDLVFEPLWVRFFCTHKIYLRYTPLQIKLSALVVREQIIRLSLVDPLEPRRPITWAASNSCTKLYCFGVNKTRKTFLSYTPCKLNCPRLLFERY